MSITVEIPTSQPAVDPDSAERLNELVQQQIKDGLDALSSAEAPSPEVILQNLTNMHVLAGVMLCVMGILYLLLGWRIFKLLLIINAAVLGAMLGGMLTVRMGYENQWWIGMIAGGAILAILAWPLMRMFLALFGAAVGAGLGYIAFGSIVVAMGREDLLPFAWAGAIAGGILLFLLAFLTFRFCVMILTALQGAAMLVNGLLIIALKLEKCRPDLINFLETNTLILPLAVLVVGMGGLLCQLSRSTKHRRKTELAEEKKGS